MPATDSQAARSDPPLVTIVTPTYNQADYLAETIESVLAQDYPNIEYIVIDDGSTDHTREILKQYTGRIRWESQANIGQAATLNRGWEKGSGEIVGYLSSDDLLKPEAVSELVSSLVSTPGITLVYPDFELIDGLGNHIRDVKTCEYSNYDLVVNLICQPGPGALFHRKYLNLIGGWDTRFRQVPDFEYWLRLSRYGDFKRIPKILSSFRVHEASQSFNVASVERAMEPVYIVDNFYANAVSSRATSWSNKARGKSRLLAAKMLFRSKKVLLGLKQLISSVYLSPSLFRSATLWRILLSGLFGKFLYRSFYVTKK